VVTFIHDHVFLKYDNQFYTSGSLNREIMRRYINVFGGIRLVTRCREVKRIKDRLEPSSIENTEFVCVPDYKSAGKILNYFKARKIIKEEILKAQYIILRTGSFANIGARYARRYNKPYLVEVVNCAWDATWNYSFIGKIIAPLSFMFQKKTVRKADYAIYVTKNFLQKRYPTEGKNINCSDVNLTRFDNNVLKKRVKKIENMKKENKIVLGTTAAVNVAYKGQQYVIKALSKLKRQGITNFEYQLVGGGQQTYLKSVAKKYGVMNQVKFLGSISHNKVFEWLDTIDIYIQPSRQEGLPRALIEAMSRGLPAFGARTGGIPELLEDEYIFSNTRRNIDEICNILKSFNEHNMGIQAKRNYTESKRYDKNLIQERREKFFINFIKEERN
jgi:glycosyltransferase involved in cell wall biosynthesis